MYHKIREAQQGDREEGFTLIELLVVVIIIGILAAIAIPVFLNQREKAWDSAVKSDLRNAATAQETYFTDESDYTENLDDLEDAGFNNSGDVVFANDGTFMDDYDETTGYCFSAYHVSNDVKYWYFSSDTGEPVDNTTDATNCSPSAP